MNVLLERTPVLHDHTLNKAMLAPVLNELPRYFLKGLSLTNAMVQTISFSSFSQDLA